MANKTLFATALSRFLPRADAVNQAGGVAYAYGPEARLPQLAATGTPADGFYAGAETQLSDVVPAAKDVDPEWVEIGSRSSTRRRSKTNGHGECRKDYIDNVGVAGSSPASLSGL